MSFENNLGREPAFINFRGMKIMSPVSDCDMEEYIYVYDMVANAPRISDIANALLKYLGSINGIDTSPEAMAFRMLIRRINRERVTHKRICLKYRDPRRSRINVKENQSK